jgi:hypothetical protein
METMAGHLHKVTFKEQLIICHVIREYSNEQRYAHLTPALLPFVSLQDVREALGMQRASRPVAAIIAKIGSGTKYLERTILNARKVAKVFGPDPSKGRRFNWLPPTLDRGKPIDPVVALQVLPRTRQSNGSIVCYVVVHEAFRQPVLAWLVDNLT